MPIRWVRGVLLTPPDAHFSRRTLLAFVLSLGGSLLLVALVLGALGLAGITIDDTGLPEREAGVGDFLGMVLLAPLIETLVLIAFLALLPARIGIVPRAAISALLWGGLHALAAPFWFFGVVWSFFVFSCGWLAWRPESFAHGFAAAAIPHALQNLTVFLVLAVAD
ncbi:hypothetical protein [Xanthomonas sp. XNM01]|uniref:hypothetical protein n=1 Tax=Xanthomonas sp. XNM01 TaxID=2769289 RepID=UPI001CE18E5C|nr:hypothetical protein [Xanthomonas sp. XNM01]